MESFFIIHLFILFINFSSIKYTFTINISQLARIFPIFVSNFINRKYNDGVNFEISTSYTKFINSLVTCIFDSKDSEHEERKKKKKKRREGMQMAKVQFQNRVIAGYFIRSVRGSSGSRYPIMQFTLQVRMIRRTMRTMEEKRAGRCKWIMMPMDIYVYLCVCVCV